MLVSCALARSKVTKELEQTLFCLVWLVAKKIIAMKAENHHTILSFQGNV
jgi:hypothetical protein